MDGAQHPVVVDRALAAANDGDTEQFLSCFPPDGVVDDWGRRFVGADSIRGWSDREFIGEHVSLEVLAVSVDQSTTTVLAQVGGNGFRGRSHFAFDVDVDADVVRSMTITA